VSGESQVNNGGVSRQVSHVPTPSSIHSKIVGGDSTDVAQAHSGTVGRNFRTKCGIDFRSPPVSGLPFLAATSFVIGAVADAAFAGEGGEERVKDGPPDCRIGL